MTALTSLHRANLARAGCEVRCDDHFRMLYATDASIYQVVPAAVALPRNADEASAVVRAAAEVDLAVVPRGAGTGLAGGAVGEGLVVELARDRRVWDLDREAATVRVGPGVVLDQLNAYLRSHELRFGPDVATSSRATIGGMIANNSSGAQAPVYGTTVDHVVDLDLVLADGTTATVGSGADGLSHIRDAADLVVAAHADAIAERMPPGLVKQWPGYGFDDYLGGRGDLTRLVTGSEGTLAVVTAARLRVVPLPTRRGLGVVFFESVADAMQATVELLDLEPAAIELIDRLLFDQTRGQLAFASARSLLGLDEDSCEAILLVEFFDDVDDRLREVERRRLGVRTLCLTDDAQQEMVWGVRKAGLSLLTGCKGPAKPTACIEDVCVRPQVLPEYVAGLREILDPLGLEASFYGHAASGELHVRPTLDLHTADGVAKLRHVADAVSDLCRRFEGSLAAEHGVGIARTEYLPDHLGQELLEAARDIKRLFDPKGLLNPGKIVDTGRYRIDRDLRLGASYELRLPFAPVTGFVERDQSFVANLEQCNGCGGCRKDAPTMCPTFVATGDELMSTRGRANTVRAMLEGRLDQGLDSRQLEEALGSCLSCKACKRECPSNVDLALLKAELTHARHGVEGIPILDRVVAASDRLGRLGTATAPVANAVLSWRPARLVMQWILGLNADRSLPPYASQRFDHWFMAREGGRSGGRGRVLLWDDTWVRYHEPGIGRAAVQVLAAAGFEVALVDGRRCCGRPAASRGLLDEVRRLGEHNLALVAGRAEPIVFLEPSCYSMFVDDYRQLRLADADSVAARCVLFEQLLDGLLDREPEALAMVARTTSVAIHAHCHAKALTDVAVLPRLAARIPGATVELLNSGCCGMAGAFGLLRAKDQLSRAVARPLVDMVRRLPQGTRVVASGTSCRHQLRELAGVAPLHMAELLAEVLRTDQERFP